VPVRVRWFGQSAFELRSNSQTVMIDPFGDGSALAERGMEFGYPPIAGVEADLVLVTHEHFDHNAVGLIGGEPAVIRSTAGKPDSPIGEVVAIASEHDERAGTERGPNSIFVFQLGGLRTCHMGDFGQTGLRPEQAGAIGPIDLLFIPVGGGPTIGAEQAAAVVELLEPALVVPMHYRTPAVNFLETADDFLGRFPDPTVTRCATNEFDTAEVRLGEGAPTIVVPAPPGP
jgi:L-ascorbate metabolism protein UlaG (beta-lactamase superfamily)